jgi:hypothetical protein
MLRMFDHAMVRDEIDEVGPRWMVILNGGLDSHESTTRIGGEWVSIV